MKRNQHYCELDNPSFVVARIVYSLKVTTAMAPASGDAASL